MILGEKVHLELKVESDNGGGRQRPLEEIIREREMTDIEIIP